jgi:tryptophan synthase alpha chain
MTNRIDKRFRELKRKKEKAFIVYITAGDPTLACTSKLIKELDSGGVDMVELGVPFSDPIADGPTIQAASERALKNGVNLKGIFGVVRKARKATDIPIALMTYYNPIYAYGISNFARDASAAGVDGVIVPDLPPEEAVELIKASGRHGLKHIFLLSPTSTPDRIRLVGRKSSGFIYYVSLTGVTGARKKLPPEIVDNVNKIKSRTRKPVCVGFGVSNPAQARSIAKAADGVIVGSAVIKFMEKMGSSPGMTRAVGRFVRGLSKAVKGV